MTQTLKIIEYDHDIKDKVFFMMSNKVVEGEVSGIVAYVNKDRGAKVVKIEYSIKYRHSAGGISNAKLQSNQVFESKSKLLDSL